MARKPSNQALERTADRRENLLSMTSTQNVKAQFALISGRRLALFLSAALCLCACGNSLWAQQAAPTPPMHPFKKRLYDQIGAAWYRDLPANLKKIPLGTARIAFSVSPDGKITKLRVLSNTSNNLFADICLRAIQKAKIPPVPAELLSHGKFEDEISFTTFPNPSPARDLTKR
jgi:outer membrane biosynthesis protein TonB